MSGEIVKYGVTNKMDAVSLGALWLDFVKPSNSYILGATSQEESPFNLTTGLTITSSSKNIIGASGIMAPHPVDTLPWVYDTYGQPAGIRVEEGDTNLLLNSKGMSDLTFSAASHTANRFVAPDGTITMSRINENAANTVHKGGKTINVTGGQRVQASYHLRRAERHYVALVLLDSTGKTGEVEINLITGACVGTANATWVASEIGDGIWKLAATMTTDGAATTATAELHIRETTQVDSYAGDVDAGIFAGMGQVTSRIDSVHTSWIETAGASATRAGDVIEVPAATMLSLKPLGFGGTVVLEFTPELGVGRLLSVNSNTPNSIHRIGANVTQSACNFNAASKESDQTTIGTSISQNNSGSYQGRPCRVAYRFSNGRRRIISSLNPGSPQDDLVAQSLFNLTVGNTGTMRIGNWVSGDGGGNMPIRRVGYFNRGLTDDQLVRMVTDL